MFEQTNCDCGENFENLTRTGNGDLYYCDKCEIYYKTKDFKVLYLIEEKIKKIINEQAAIEEQQKKEQEKQDYALKIQNREERRLKQKEDKIRKNEAKIHELLSPIDQLYFICPLSNLKSIMVHGILPKNTLKKMNISFSDYSDKEVQNLRDQKRIILTDGKAYRGHDVVPLYFNYNTPTSYIMINRNKECQFVFICVSKLIVFDMSIEYAFTDGNLASNSITSYNDLNYLNLLDWEIINSPNATYQFQDKRAKCSEFLISQKVDFKHFSKIIVKDTFTVNKVVNILSEIDKKISIEINSSCY